MKEVKLIIAGGRDFDDYQKLVANVYLLLESRPDDETFSIVSGMARGADAMGAYFAKQEKCTLYEFPANWDLYGKRAGYVRNEAMGKFADMLLAFWDGKSRGTQHMIQFMYSINKPVKVINY